jgi:hypothetical protein
MSDNNLRKQLIKLAYTNKELRPHLLPILKEASDKSFEEAVKGKKFKNPATGNDVLFGSLPAQEQKKIREQWKSTNKGESKSKSKKDDEFSDLEMIAYDDNIPEKVIDKFNEKAQEAFRNLIKSEGIDGSDAIEGLMKDLDRKALEVADKYKAEDWYEETKELLKSSVAGYLENVYYDMDKEDEDAEAYADQIWQVSQEIRDFRF